MHFRDEEGPRGHFFVVFGILGYPDAFFFLNPYVPIHVFGLLSCFDPNFIHCIFFEGFLRNYN